MIELITAHAHDLIVFAAGAAVEYFGGVAIARIKALHPGKTLLADFEAKIEKIVDAKIAAANTNATSTTSTPVS